MGFFDLFSAKKANPPSAPVSNGTTAATAGGVIPRLVTARERLEAKDLPGAMAIYEEVLAAAGDRADVLVAISGDLGSTGHVREIIDLVAPRYDAERHGPATGLNLLQAYLALRNAEAAQHVLDLLFALQRPELEDRLHGFSNAIAELISADLPTLDAATPAGDAPRAEPPKINLVSISKPIWFYGLESLAAQILPAKTGTPRRVAFTQLAVLGLPDPMAAMQQPEDALGRFSRGLPLWLAEAFCFSPHYAPIAASGIFNGKNHAVFGAEWTTENLRQLADTAGDGLDYIITGALRQTGGDTELLLRVWEVKKMRERKTFSACWNAATADTALAQLHEQVRRYMEWSPAKTGLAYTPPAQPTVWIDTLGTALSLFLGEKGLLAKDQVVLSVATLDATAAQAAGSAAASLAWLTLGRAARRLDLVEQLVSVQLYPSALVQHAQETLG